MLHRFIAGIVRPVDMVGDEVEVVGRIFADHFPGIIKRSVFGMDIVACPLAALIFPAGIRRYPGELCQMVFVSVRVNGIFPLGKENKVLLRRQDGNQPPAGGIFRVIQVAVEKDMVGNFGGAHAFGHGFQIQIIAAAAQDEGARQHNGGDNGGHEDRHDKHDEV